MQRNNIVLAALVAALAIGATSAGFVVAYFTSYSGHNYAGQYQNAGNGSSAYTASPSPAASGGASSAMGSSGSMPAGGSMDPSAHATPGDGSTFTDSSLAQFIGRKAGTSLAGRAPQNVPASQVKALSEQRPANASIDSQTRTINFYAGSVSFTVVAVAPGTPDMSFTVAGLTNPTIIVPAGARVTVQFVNGDTDEAHGWLVTDHTPPYEFGQPATPAIAGAYAGVVGDPTAAGDGANTVTFAAGGAGSYHYICPMPGHAQMGMSGSFIVR